VPDGNHSPAIQLFSDTLISAIERQARELLVEIDEKQTSLKLRFDDGLTETVATIARLNHPVIIGRLKNIANLDIAERRIPQQGCFRLKHQGGLVDVSVSIIPTEHGENAVLGIGKKW